MKILVAVDGSSYTKRMLAYLAAHDEWLGGHHEYTLLHTLTPLPARAASVIDKATLEAWHAESADKVFKPVRTFFKKQMLNATFASKVGEPGDVIPAMAKKGGFDLVILGSHGHGALMNLVTGSVTTKVLAACTVPVLVIR